MRKKRIVNRIGRVISYSSLGILALLLLAILLPTVKDTSSAADCAPGEEPCTTTQAEAGIDLTVASTVSVALQNLINLEVTPKTSGAFTESTAKLTVATNNPSGYAVYMQAGSTTNGKASLVSSDLSNTAMISPVSGTVESSSFSANTWGYSLDGTHYQAVPATTGIIKETSSTTFSDTYDLSFGVNVDTNLPAGQYTNSVIVSAVANPIKVTSLSQLNYMQDMTTDICTNTAEHVTKQLIDTRDGKSYWIAKLKDGNCWMTQNLAFTITQEMIDSNSINSTNTDINYVWNKESANAPKPTEGNESLYGVDEYQRSWNFGEYVLATPKEYEACRNDSGEGSFPLGADWSKICEGVGLVNVSSDEWKPTFMAQEKTIRNAEYVRKTITLSNDTTATIYIPASEAVARNADRDENGNLIPYEYTGLVAVDPDAKTYDAHYLLGNYYQWSTAVAGYTEIEAGVQSENSICPKGWTLPTTAKDSDSQPMNLDDSFYRLFLSLGYLSGQAWLDSYKNPTVTYTNGNHAPQYPIGAPLYYVRGGNILINNEKQNFQNIGNFGELQSGTKTPHGSGYTITLHTTYMGLAYVWQNKAEAASVRCLAR